MPPRIIRGGPRRAPPDEARGPGAGGRVPAPRGRAESSPMVVSGAEKLSAAVYVARRPRSGPKKRPPRPPPGRSRAPAGAAPPHEGWARTSTRGRRRRRPNSAATSPHGRRARRCRSRPPPTLLGPRSAPNAKIPAPLDVPRGRLGAKRGVGATFSPRRGRVERLRGAKQPWKKGGKRPSPAKSLPKWRTRKPITPRRSAGADGSPAASAGRPGRPRRRSAACWWRQGQREHGQSLPPIAAAVVERVSACGNRQERRTESRKFQGKFCTIRDSFAAPNLVFLCV